MILSLERNVRIGREGEIKMRHPVSRFLQLTPEQLRRIRLDDDLRLEIRPSPVTKEFMVLPCEAIRASVDAASVTVDRVAPPAFPIGGKRFCDHLLCCGFLKNLELCGRRFANVLGGVAVVRIWWIRDVSHRCNNSATVAFSQELQRRGSRIQGKLS